MNLWQRVERMEQAWVADRLPPVVLQLGSTVPDWLGRELPRESEPDRSVILKFGDRVVSDADLGWITHRLAASTFTR